VRESILGRQRTERALLHFARSYLAEAFPNPERKNCPSDDALQQLACQPVLADESLTKHLSCCSPCFRTYMAHLGEGKSHPAPFFSLQRLTASARPALALGAVAILLMVSLVVLVKRPRSVSVVIPTPVPFPAPSPSAQEVAAYLPVVIDLTNRAAVRGLEPGHRAAPTWVSARVDLTVRLPLGIEEGIYTVRIRSRAGVVWAESVAAHRESGETILHARADLAALAAGSYDLEVHSRALGLSAPIFLNSRETN
jgi:hypothetical protein